MIGEASNKNSNHLDNELELAARQLLPVQGCGVIGKNEPRYCQKSVKASEDRAIQSTKPGLYVNNFAIADLAWAWSPELEQKAQ